MISYDEGVYIKHTIVYKCINEQFAGFKYTVSPILS